MNQLKEQAMEMLKNAGAIWIYKGKPDEKYPHAQLASGKCSDGYVNVGDVLKNNPIVRIALAEYLIIILHKVWYENFDFIVGADTSSTLLAQDIAKMLGVGHIKMTKTQDEQGKRQVWDKNNPSLCKNSLILQVEDLITTGNSALQVRKGTELANPGIAINFAPFLPTIVNRSGEQNKITKIGNSTILSLLNMDIQTFEPGDCPYCKVGSIPVRPKDGNNWQLLTKKH